MICLNVCVFVCFKGGETRAVQDDTWLRVSGVGVDRRRPRCGTRWTLWHGTATYTVGGPAAGSLGRARRSRPQGGEAKKVLSRL
jgi:hypothetical protein